VSHATWNAIGTLLGEDRRGPGVPALRACSWSRINLGLYPYDAFEAWHARDLLRGEAVDLPTCPTCAVFVDMALEIRMQAQQEAA
jgi:hypothetical protein